MRRQDPTITDTQVAEALDVLAQATRSYVAGAFESARSTVRSRVQQLVPPARPQTAHVEKSEVPLRCFFCYELFFPGPEACPHCGLPLGQEVTREEVVAPAKALLPSRWFIPVCALSLAAIAFATGILLGRIGEGSEPDPQTIVVRQPVPAAQPAPAAAEPAPTAAPAASEPVSTTLGQNVTPWPQPTGEPPPVTEAANPTTPPIPEMAAWSETRTTPGTVPPPHVLAWNPFQFSNDQSVFVWPSWTNVTDVSIEYRPKRKRRQ